MHLHSEKFEGYYRFGILTSPYSDYMVFQMNRVWKTYIEMIENAYELGYMNTIGFAYKFGKNRSWFIGPEFRLDFLTAGETPIALIEQVTGIRNYLHNYKE